MTRVCEKKRVCFGTRLAVCLGVDKPPPRTMFWSVILGFFLAEFLFHGIPEVSAFSGLSFGSTFRFPNVPLREGIRHIHTLEHLENITTTASRNSRPLPHYFDIQRVSQPQRYGDHVSVCVHTKVRGYPQTIYMLSRPDHPETCTFMCIQDGTQRAMVQLRVGRLSHQFEGHRLLVSCTYFTGPRVFDRDMEPVMRFLRFFEHRMKPPVVSAAAGAPTRGRLHANLQWYRRMVLGLEN